MKTFAIAAAGTLTLSGAGASTAELPSYGLMGFPITPLQLQVVGSANVKSKRPALRNCFAVRSAARHVSQFYDQFLVPIGLRTTQFSILAKLKQREPLTINALAKDMVMDRTTLGRNIVPLERDGLIRIEPIACDRRVKELHLTNTGEKRLQAALKAWTQAQAQFETNFGTKRAAELRALLRSVVASEFTSTAHRQCN